MTTSPKLGLTLMAANMAQKEVVFNNLLIAFDALFAGTVLSATTATPPGSPALGDAYILPASSTGLWSGHDHAIAFYYNGWQFITPPLKLRLYVVDVSGFETFQGSGGGNWVLDAVGTVSVLDDLSNVEGTPTDGQVLTWSASDAQWEPASPTFTATLASLTDVEVTEGIGIAGHYLQWNNTMSKWTAVTFPTIYSTFLSLTDLESGGRTNNFILAYDTTGPGVKFVNPTGIISVGSLADIGDVSYGGSTPATGNYLQFNGAAWVPSGDAVTITFGSISDGPGTLTGHASDYIRVNVAETALEYMTPAALSATVIFGDLSGIVLTSPANGDVLKFDGTHWINSVSGGAATLTGLSDVNAGDSSLSDGKFLYWNNSDGKWEVAPLSAVASTGAYSDISGKPSFAAVATSGSFTDLTSVPSSLSYTLSGLGDVQLTSLTNGQVLIWNSVDSKWENGSGGGGGGGGSALAITNNGTSVDTAATTLNFVNATSITTSSHVVTVTLPTGGGGGGGVSLPAEYEIGPLAPPSPSLFTDASQSGITATITAETGKGTLFSYSGLGSGAYFAISNFDISAWPSTWAVTARLKGSNFTGAFPSYGFVVGDGSGKLGTYGITGDGNGHSRLGADKWHSISSYDTNIFGDVAAPPPEFIRIRWDGTSVYFGFSYDNLIWNEKSTNPGLSGITSVGLGGSIFDSTGDFQSTTAGFLCTYLDIPGHSAADNIVPTSAVLGDLANVVLTSPVANDVLTFNGTDWVNEPAFGSEWVNVTFGTTATKFTISGMGVSDQTFTVAAGKTFEVEAYIYKASGSTGLLGISGDSGASGYIVFVGNDGNYGTNYYTTGSSFQDIISSGGNSSQNWTGTHRLNPTLVHVGSSDNRIYTKFDGFTQSIRADTHVDISAALTIYIETDDLTKCFVRARIV